MAGGNTETLYQGNGRLKMAESLQKQHPDIVSVSWKFNRYQHHVDYSGFRRNRLILKKGQKVKKGINNYGMKLISLKECLDSSRSGSTSTASRSNWRKRNNHDPTKLR
jgi:hypothetical protein